MAESEVEELREALALHQAQLVQAAVYGQELLAQNERLKGELDASIASTSMSSSRSMPVAPGNFAGQEARKSEFQNSKRPAPTFSIASESELLASVRLPRQRRHETDPLHPWVVEKEELEAECESLKQRIAWLEAEVEDLHGMATLDTSTTFTSTHDKLATTSASPAPSLQLASASAERIREEFEVELETKVAELQDECFSSQDLVEALRKELEDQKRKLSEANNMYSGLWQQMEESRQALRLTQETVKAKDAVIAQRSVRKVTTDHGDGTHVASLCSEIHGDAGDLLLEIVELREALASAEQRLEEERSCLETERGERRSTDEGRGDAEAAPELHVELASRQRELQKASDRCAQVAPYLRKLSADARAMQVALDRDTADAERTLALDRPEPTLWNRMSVAVNHMICCGGEGREVKVPAWPSNQAIRLLGAKPESEKDTEDEEGPVKLASLPRTPGSEEQDEQGPVELVSLPRKPGSEEQDEQGPVELVSLPRKPGSVIM